VFLIQNSQNRDGMALQAKLDELIRAVGGANNVMLNLEELDEDTLLRLRKHYCRLAERARDNIGDLLDKYEREADEESPQTEAASAKPE
ncbi:MAG: low affinity iron permease family protein, partial [Rhodanobacteraceae bacterium]